MYTEKELADIARRENNNKRNYLVVNRLQGKHVPVNPKSCLKLFDELAAIVAKEYQEENVLLVGFAETATAIGSRLAANMDCYYMQTTREKIEGVEYLYFTESHSHATQQKLIKTDLDKVIDEIQRIVFVEDEVTTGNTIWKIVDMIQKEYEQRIAFSVASLLNGMDEKARKMYEERKINLHYLVKTNHSSYMEAAERYRGDGIYHGYPQSISTAFHIYQANQYVNGRRLLKGMDYQRACHGLFKQMEQWFSFFEKESILVIGTEEFMYPAIYAASMMAKAGCEVKCHSTTRSPIAVSTEAEYPLHVRYELHSLYDEERRTFIYDLEKYDKVIVITDSLCESERGIRDLCSVLEECGNTDIRVIRWCE